MSIDVLFGAVAVVLVLLPPRLDPAIRLKEWLARKKRTDSR